MVAYNFQARFAEDVESGRKCQTIRLLGKRRHAQPGDMLQLYTGMRSPGCRLLREAPCVVALAVSIDEAGRISVGGQPLDGTDADLFAQADGFAIAEELVDYFRDAAGLPFRGVVIKWAATSIPQSGDWN